jgi:hypothetical protein
LATLALLDRRTRCPVEYPKFVAVIREEDPASNVNRLSDVDL